MNNSLNIDKKPIKIIDLYDIMYVFWLNKITILLITTICFFVGYIFFNNSDADTYTSKQLIKLDVAKETFIARSFSINPLDKLFFNIESKELQIQFAKQYDSNNTEININNLSSNAFDPDTSVAGDTEYYINYMSTDKIESKKIANEYSKFIINYTELQILDILKTIYIQKINEYNSSVEKNKKLLMHTSNIAKLNIEQEILQVKNDINIAKTINISKILPERMILQSENFLYGSDILEKKLENLNSIYNATNYLSGLEIEATIKLMRQAIDKPFEDYYYNLSKNGFLFSEAPKIYYAHLFDVSTNVKGSPNLVVYVFLIFGFMISLVIVLLREGIRGKYI